MYQNFNQPQQQMNPYYQYRYQPQFIQPMPIDMQQAQTVQTQPQAQNYLKGRPVVSIEEARAAQIDLDGSLFVFTDIGNKKIYTKQLTIDGTPAFNTYELVQNVTPEPVPEYVTKGEFDEVISQLAQMKQLVSTLQDQLQKAQHQMNEANQQQVIQMPKF